MNETFNSIRKYSVRDLVEKFEQLSASTKSSQTSGFFGSNLSYIQKSITKSEIYPKEVPIVPKEVPIVPIISDPPKFVQKSLRINRCVVKKNDKLVQIYMSDEKQFENFNRVSNVLMEIDSLDSKCSVEYCGDSKRWSSKSAHIYNIFLISYVIAIRLPDMELDDCRIGHLFLYLAEKSGVDLKGVPPEHISRSVKEWTTLRNKFKQFREFYNNSDI